MNNSKEFFKYLAINEKRISTTILLQNIENLFLGALTREGEILNIRQFPTCDKSDTPVTVYTKVTPGLCETSLKEDAVPLYLAKREHFLSLMEFHFPEWKKGMGVDVFLRWSPSEIRITCHKNSAEGPLINWMQRGIGEVSTGFSFYD